VTVDDGERAATQSASGDYRLDDEEQSLGPLFPMGP
jgi:hypothetical protein